MQFTKLAISAAIAFATVSVMPVNAAWFSDNQTSTNGSVQSINGSSPSGNTSSSSSSSATGRVADDNALGGIKIPEPSNLFMLGLGIAGLVAGRYAAKRKRKNL